MHGFLNLDKPAGISSAKAVAEVKKLLQCSKIGHGGTLDPLASGILPLAIGEATKAFDYIASSRKEYLFTITFGEERDTDDAEGTVTATTDQLPSAEEIQRILPEFIGTIQQTPPAFSALKINGERAYKLARAGEAPEMVARPVEIYTLALVTDHRPQATFHVACGKGTYVRSLARDIARKVSSLGYISMLRRTRVGKFSADHAISLDKLREFVHSAAPFDALIPLELALDDIPAIKLDQEQTARLRHGQTLSVLHADGSYMALYEGRLQAFVEVAGGVLKAKRVFNLN